MEIFIIILLVVTTIYLFFRKIPGSYFLLISFDWKDIYEIFELSEAEQESLKINKNYDSDFLRNYGVDSTEIDSMSANFEYYILPNTVRNGGYKTSIIYDQFFKRFFDGISIKYFSMFSGDTLSGDDLNIFCVFSRVLMEGKTGFSIHFHKVGIDDSTIKPNNIKKTLYIFFDSEYLNIQNIHKKWGEHIPYKLYLSTIINNSQESFKEVRLEKNKIWINTGIQSVKDESTIQVDSGLYKYLKK